MPMNYSPGQPSFGLLPEPEGRTASFITSTTINMVILAAMMIAGMTAKRVIQQHYEITNLILPNTPPPERVKPPELPKLPPPPKQPEVTLEAPKIEMPKPESKPPEKAIEMEAKIKLPAVKVQPAIVLAPQPKAALAVAMPVKEPEVRGKAAPVHFGQPFGVTPNPNAAHPATVAAIGNPYGGMRGPAVAPHGVVGSAGIGNGGWTGSNAGAVGRVASADIPGMTASTAPKMASKPASTNLEVLFKPPVHYTSEARQLHIQGEVVLRVTFLATGQVVVQSVVHGLGHGLDEEARREAEQIRFRPATRDGRPVNLTTDIVITFQLA